MPPMLHTAYKVTTTRNVYGDYVESSRVTLKCHFREITSIVEGSNVTIQSDAMAWFEPDSGVVKKDILIIDGQGFKVERITKARRLRNPDVLFIKAELTKYGVIS